MSGIRNVSFCEYTTPNESKPVWKASQNQKSEVHSEPCQGFAAVVLHFFDKQQRLDSSTPKMVIIVKFSVLELVEQLLSYLKQI